jgi:hypothetical protein
MRALAAAACLASSSSSILRSKQVRIATTAVTLRGAWVPYRGACLHRGEMPMMHEPRAVNGAGGPGGVGPHAHLRVCSSCDMTCCSRCRSAGVAGCTANSRRLCSCGPPVQRRPQSARKEEGVLSVASLGGSTPTKSRQQVDRPGRQNMPCACSAVSRSGGSPHNEGRGRYMLQRHARFHQALDVSLPGGTYGGGG